MNGQGNRRGAPPPQQQQQQQQQQHQHGNMLSSVGNAASLFGAGDDGQQYSQEYSQQDFFNEQQYAQYYDQQHAGEQQQQQHQQQHGGGGGGIGTVFEEDEPESSPEMGRHEQFQQHQLYTAQYGSEQQDDDWYGAQHQQQQATAGGYDQQQQPPYDYSQASNVPHQQTSAYDYSQQQQQYGASEDQSADAQAQYYDQSGAQAEHFEPPYYPGFRYDPATNSYVPDPTSEPPSGWNEQAESAAAADDASWQGAYQGQDQQQHGDSAETPRADDVTAFGQDETNEPEPSYAGTWDQQQTVSQANQAEAAAGSDSQQQSWDDYHEDQDPYADQADPFAQSEEPQTQMADAPHGAMAAQSGQSTAQYDEQAQYDQGQYDSSQYDQGQYGGGQYDQASYDQATYDQAQYDQNQYDQSQYGQYDQQAYGESYDGTAQYDQGAYGQQYPNEYGAEPAQATAAATSPTPSSRSLPQGQQPTRLYDQADQQQGGYGLQADYDSSQASYDQQYGSYDQQSWDQQQSHDESQPQAQEQHSTYDTSTAYSQPQQAQDRSQAPNKSATQQPMSYQPQQPRPYDPYAPQQPAFDPYAPPQVGVARASRAGSGSSRRSNAASPPLASPSASQATFSPPPRTSSRGSAQTAAVPPPRKALAQTASSQATAPPKASAPPPRAKDVAVAPPPPRASPALATAPPPPRSKTPVSSAQPSRPQGSRNDSFRSTASSSANEGGMPPPPPLQQSSKSPLSTSAQAPPPRARSPAVQPPPVQTTMQAQQQPRDASTPIMSPVSPSQSAASLYSPPPAKRSGYQGPASRPPPSASAARGPPPVQPRRAPHMRGPSAFAGDSPYGPMPTDFPGQQSGMSTLNESTPEQEVDPDMTKPEADYEQPQPQPPTRARPGPEASAPVSQPPAPPKAKSVGAPPPPPQASQGSAPRQASSSKRRPQYAPPPSIQTALREQSGDGDRHLASVPQPETESAFGQAQAGRYEPSQSYEPQQEATSSHPDQEAAAGSVRPPPPASSVPSGRGARYAAAGGVPPPPPSSQAGARVPPRASAAEVPPQQQQKGEARTVQPAPQMSQKTTAPPPSRQPYQPDTQQQQQQQQQQAPLPQSQRPMERTTAPPPPAQGSRQPAPPPSTRGPPSRAVAPPSNQRQQEQRPAVSPSEAQSHVLPPKTRQPPPASKPQRAPQQRYQPVSEPREQEQQFDPYAPASQSRPAPVRSQQAAQQLRYGAPPPSSAKVPQLNFEAPSPEVRAQSEYDDEQPVEDEPILQDEDHQQQYAPEEAVVQGYGQDRQDEDTAGDSSIVERTPRPEHDDEYGFDDSQVFNEGAMSASTSGSNYGEWTGRSEAQEGYDYVGDGVAGAGDLPEDMYGPADVPSREGSETPQSREPGMSPDKYGYSSLYDSPRKPSTQTLVPDRDEEDESAPADPYAPSSQAGPSSVQGEADQGQEQQAYDPYAPSANGDASAQSNYPAYDTESAYAPYVAQPARRYSSDDQGPPSLYDPYARPTGLARQMSTTSLASTGAVPCDLGLERSRAPVVSFGFGGKILLVYPGKTGSSASAYGSDSPYGVASTASSSPNSVVHVRKLDDILSTPDTLKWPGPIYMDGGKANAGKKRKEAVAWLDQRAEELEKEVQYAKGAMPVAGSSADGAGARRRKLETRLVLVKLVKVLVENEGKLGGTPKIDEAVRAILVPHSAHHDLTDVDLPTASQLAYTGTSSSRGAASGDEAPLATYTVTPSNLDQLTTLLLRGERRKAVKFALDHKLWAHAFIISSCVDTDCWKDVVMEFLKSELTPPPDAKGDGVNGREGMRVAYSMFAGFGAESIQQFVPPVALAPNLLPQLPTQTLVQGSPVGPPEQMINANLSESVLERWQETAALIIANRTAGDSAALTALGDALLANGWLDAAHVCFLLSPSTSLIGGPATPSARITLLGTTTPSPTEKESIDVESVMLTELVEFAFSLAPTTKGQEPFLGFPHLQPYKLFHATLLADAGHVAQATKYAEAMAAVMKQANKPSPYWTPVATSQLKALTERVTAAPNQDKPGSWITRMVPRGPTKETLWSTLEGGFTKFVSGDDAAPAKSQAPKPDNKSNGARLGPFSQFSSISPGSTSGTLSRAQSSTDLAANSTLAPPSRPASSASVTTPTPSPSLAPPHAPTSQGPPPVKRAPFKTHHSRSSSLGVAGYNYDPNAPPPWAHINTRNLGGNAPDLSTPRAQQNNGGWYGPDAGNASDGPKTPMHGSTEQTLNEDDSGFISPMGAGPTPSASKAGSYGSQSGYQPQQQSQQQSHKRTTTQDELDDLGIGNNKSRKPGFDAISEQAGESDESDPYAPKKTAAPADEQKPAPKPELKPSASKSWLGGWFKREASPVNNGPGPVKANLGDQKSFVYDSELKRWVMKGASKESSGPLATAPPPRAATASPSRGMRGAPPRFQTETPPPLPNNGAVPAPLLNRSATTNDLRNAGSFRSSSVPAQGVAPPPRPPSASGGSGASTPGGAAGRRKAKPRYVPVT